MTRQNPMPLYTHFLETIQTHNAHKEEVDGVGTSSVDPKTESMFEVIATKAVPFDFSDLAEEVIERMAQIQDHGQEATIELVKWIRSLPACLPPYPYLVAEMSTETLTGLARSIVLMETLPISEAEEAWNADLSDFGTDARWVTSFQAYVFFGYDRHGINDNDVMSPSGNGLIVFDEHGQLICFDSPYENDLPFEIRFVPAETIKGAWAAHFHQSIDDVAAAELQRSFALNTVCLAIYSLFGCSLLHCKNVEEKTTYLPRQSQRLRQRQGLPEVTWKTLVVRPTRKPQTKSEESDLTNEKAKKRLHGVRGHFARYGPEYGTGRLFGKHSGVFYIPGHWRGLSDIGTIKKTYDVRKELLLPENSK